MKLVDPPWASRDGFDALVRALGDETRVVGGAVRDTLLNLPVADIDLATQLLPEAVMSRLRDAGIKAVPTGIDHGTVTAVLPSGPVEVTTLRRDVSTDGRRAKVAFSDDWQEDAARRDFTMNALYADPGSGELFDYFGGLDDLNAGRVRFIGDPLRRIAEDHLRILRFFRFLARFGDRPDADGLAACTSRARDLMALSRERIADELLKLLVARQAPAILRLMVDRDILVPVLPEIDLDGVMRLEALAAHESRAGIASNAIRRLAALLPMNAETLGAVGARLKLSNAQKKRLEHAARPVGDADARSLAYLFGVDMAIDGLLLAGRPVDALDDFTPPVLPLSGGALIARGLPKGPRVAATLKAIERAWIDEGFPDAARLDELVDQALKDESSRNA